MDVSEKEAPKDLDKTAVARENIESDGFLKKEIKAAEKYFKEWNERCDKIYREWKNPQKRKSNIFASNCKLERPALYSRTPRVVSKVRYDESAAEAGVGSKMLERNTQFQVDDESRFDLCMRASVQDAQLYSRGVARVRYDPEFVTVQQATDDAPAVEDLASERVEWVFVSRKNFLHSRNTSWDKVWWVGFKEYLSYQDMEDRFGKDVARKVEYKHRDDPGSRTVKTGDDIENPMVEVIELWCKLNRKVYFLTECYEGFLDVIDDPLGLKEFFPCPRPLMFNVDADDLRPTPDYLYYKSHVMELDKLMRSRYELADGLFVKGVCDESFFEQLQNLKKIGNLDFMPINIPAVAEKGGIKAVIDVIVIPEVAAMLQNLMQQEEGVKNTIFEVSGMSDIIRGVTDPNETATAQQIKGQFATMRLGDKQGEVQRFARDLINLGAEIVCEHFQPDTLIAVSGARFFPPEEQQQIEPALALIKNDGLRRISIDIETDSTIAITETLQKEAFAEFFQIVATNMLTLIQTMQATPPLTPFLMRLLMEGVRLNKVGRDLESTLEMAMQQIMQQAMNPQPPPPDPMVQIKQQELALKGQEVQQKQEQLMQEWQRIQNDMAKFAKTYEADIAKLISTNQLRAAEMQQEVDLKLYENTERAHHNTMNSIQRFSQGQNKNGAESNVRAR